MWEWDPGEGESSFDASSPTLVSNESTSRLAPPTQELQAVLIPDVQGLREQFQQQQAVLAHIKETLLENDADRTSKERQLEVYSKKLTQIKNRSRAGRNKTDAATQKKLDSSPHEDILQGSTSKSFKEISKPHAQNKMSELKKCLQENKLRYEKISEKGIADSRKIETMVEKLRNQVQERDITIHELQKNMETSSIAPEHPSLIAQSRQNRNFKKTPVILSKWTQTKNLEKESSHSEKELQVTIEHLKDEIKQQANVLIETRTNARASEDRLKADLANKNDRIIDLEEQLKKQTEILAATTAKESQVEEQLSSALLEKRTLTDSIAQLRLSSASSSNQETPVTIELERKVAELEKELDDQNKLMIRLKLDHRQKLKTLSKYADKSKKSPDDSEVERLTSKVKELEALNIGLNREVTTLKDKSAFHELEEEKLSNLLAERELEVQSLQQAITSLELKNNNFAHMTNVLSEKEEDIAENDFNAPPGSALYAIPGENSSRHFDFVNKQIQLQTEQLLMDKQESLEKIKMLLTPQDASEVTTEHTGMTFAKKRESISSWPDDDVNLADIQSKYLSMEHDFLQLTKKYERLRKENIEMVHQLTGEKVRRLQAQEEEVAAKRLQAEDEALIRDLQGSANALEGRIAALEANAATGSDQTAEYANIVIASNHTEIFNLQSALANKTQEVDVLNEKLEETFKSYRNLQIQLDEEKVNYQTLLSDVQGKQHMVETSNMRIDELMILLQEKQAGDSKSAQEYAAASDEIHTLRNELSSNVNKLESVEVQLLNKNNELSELQKIIEMLKGESSNLQDSLNALSNDNQRFREEVHRLEVSMESVLLENAQGRAMIDNQHSQILNLNKQLEESSLKCEETEKVLQKTWNERNELIQSREALLHRLRQVESDVNAIKLEKDEARKQFELQKESFDKVSLQAFQNESIYLQTKTRCEELESILQEFKNDILMKNQRLMELESELEKRCGEYTIQQNDLTAVILSRDQQIKQLEIDIECKKKELSNKHIELEDMTNKAKKLAANLKKKTQNEKELTQQVNALSSDNSKMMVAINDKADSTDKENLLREKESLVQERNMLYERIEALSSDLQNLYQQMQSAQEQNQLLVKQVKIKESEAKTIITEIARIQHEKSEILTDVQNKNQESSAAMGQLLKENDLLKLKAIEKEETFLNEKKDKEKLQLLYDNFDMQLKDLQQSIQMLKNENNLLSSQLSGCVKERDVAVNNHQEAQARVQEIGAEAKLLTEEIANLKSEVEVTNGIIKLRDDEISQLTMEVSECHDVIAARNDRLNELNATCSESHTSLSLIKDERDKYVDLYDAASLEIKSYSSQIEQLQKQVHNFNVAFESEVQKNINLKSEIESLNEKIKQIEEDNAKMKEGDGRDNKIPKKKKSVTFAEEADYIKELRSEVANLQIALAKSESSVSDVPIVTKKEECKDVQQSPSHIPLADAVELISDESLQWDDSWGAEGQLEAEHIHRVNLDSEKVLHLESQLNAAITEKEKIEQEFRNLQIKFTKVVIKLKEQKHLIEKLQSDAKVSKLASSDMWNLDSALVEELKTELSKAESRELEARKELNQINKEKESLLKQIDVLNSSNEKFFHLKESQDAEAALWRVRNAELNAEITQLQEQLAAPPDDNKLAQENRELKNLLEGLEWKVSELTELIDEKDEKINELACIKVPLDSDLKAKDHFVHIDAETKLRPTENQSTMDDSLQVVLTYDPDSNVSQILGKDMLLDEIKQLKNELNYKNQDIERIEKQLSEAISNAQLEKDRLFKLLAMKEDEVLYFKEMLQTINDAYAESKLEIERLLSEERLTADSMNLDLQAREDEIADLQRKVTELQEAYTESKIEIERLLSEDRLGSETPVESLANTQSFINAEKIRYEKIITTKDEEINTLRQTLGSYEIEFDEIQKKNSTVVQDLKWELERMETNAEKSSNENNIELQQLRTECSELRDVLAMRQPEISRLQDYLHSVQHTHINQSEENPRQPVFDNSQIAMEDYGNLLEDYNKAIKYINEKSHQFSKLEISKQAKDSEIFALKQELRGLQQHITTREIEMKQFHDYLEAELLAKDAETRELRAERLELDTELRELRSTLDRQQDVRALTSSSITTVEEVSGGRSHGTDDTAKRLQSDLDSALYMLHLRDVRCDELTFELLQLLEERDTLQLRLSTALRETEAMKQTKESGRMLETQVQHNQGQLEHKISELHTVGYGRDKNLKEESQLRHSEQMALLSRQNNTSILDI